MLDDDDDEDEDLYNDSEYDGGLKTSTRRRRLLSSGKDRLAGSITHFGPRQARVLTKLLTHAQLPGLTSLDQMHLLALADTVSTCKLDLAEKFAIDAAKSAMRALKNESEPAGEVATPESLDDCGLRFLLAMKHFTYLQRCLPLNQRLALAKRGLSSSNVIWAFHSESEEELLDMIPSVNKGCPTWSELKGLGVGWWVRNNTTLKRLMEKVAKASFQAKQDPLDAAIFYLAMKKKSLLWGLYRSVKDDRMTTFFKNDFGEDRWRKAALKNAFALLGKQRFMHAAAFFLLSGSLKDAVDICLDKLHDLQLAMVVARLYDGDLNPLPDSLRSLLRTHVLGVSPEDPDGSDLSQAHPDPFLRSMALWMCKDYSGSLATLVTRNVGSNHPDMENYEETMMGSVHENSSGNWATVKKPKKGSDEADPSVFNFYIYLRTHPLITRHNIATNSRSATGSDASAPSAIMLSGFRSESVDLTTGPGRKSEDGVTYLERRLYFSTAHFHLRTGKLNLLMAQS